jgi:hypothetical protein
MIILLISTIWLATLALAVAACRMAARGDRVARRDAERSALRVLLRSPRLLHLSASETPSRTQVISLRLEDRRSKPAPAEHVGDGAQEDLYVRP